MSQSSLIVIPARLASTRFPEKPLAEIAGMSMIERVWRIAKASSIASEVVIATDAKKIAEHVQGFGGKAVMTSEQCSTGTDRVAEVARELIADKDIYFSLQGDAVLTPPWVIDQVLGVISKDESACMVTPAVLLAGQARGEFLQLKSRGVTSGTSVVFDKNHNALYFSKSLIPFVRDENAAVYRHIGLYAYQRKTLLELCELEQGKLEQAEKLEQLRALENGIPIRVVEVDYRGRTHGSVDRPEDVKVVEEIISREGELI